MSCIPSSFSEPVQGSRPSYIYDRAGIISSAGESMLDSYLRQLDDATSDEIVIYTIPSFFGHGIKKNGQEIHDRDTLANYVFNEVPLDGIQGIGKKNKDNGVLILFSLEKDAGGGSMRIEVGKGLEGNITDGTAGAILDSYLVPARESYDQNGNTKVFDKAFLDTVIALAQRTGYVNTNPNFASSSQNDNNAGDSIDPVTVIAFVVFFGVFVAMALLRGRRRGRGGFYGGGFGGGGGWGGGGGGGGGSGGGGAGR
jgi:uncharacterized protein